jgi:curved DNA-binding protein CbpA
MANKLDFIYDSDIFIDLYDIIGIDMEANIDEIKSAYIKLAKTHHPDHGGNSEMFQQITKAYEILNNKEVRKEYDLYYLKKSMDEINNDNINRLKSDFTNFINSNTKPVTQEKLDEMYADIFKDREEFKSVAIDTEEFNKRLNDISLERDNTNIESFDDKMLNIINTINSNCETPISISDFFEYIKFKNNKNNTTDITIQEFGTLDTLPGYGNNYTSFVSDNEFFASNIYSDILTPSNDSLKLEEEINVDDFTNWKHNKKNSNKLTDVELDNYLEKRKLEEDEISQKIKVSLENSTKKKEVEKFLKNNYLLEDISKNNKNSNESNITENILDIVDKKDESINNIKKREFI